MSEWLCLLLAQERSLARLVSAQLVQFALASPSKSGKLYLIHAGGFPMGAA
jgi:hypothetical protein